VSNRGEIIDDIVTQLTGLTYGASETIATVYRRYVDWDTMGEGALPAVSIVAAEGDPPRYECFGNRLETIGIRVLCATTGTDDASRSRRMDDMLDAVASRLASTPRRAGYAVDTRIVSAGRTDESRERSGTKFEVVAGSVNLICYWYSGG
jgi:hypothetical protein